MIITLGINKDISPLVEKALVWVVARGCLTNKVTLLINTFWDETSIQGPGLSARWCLGWRGEWHGDSAEAVVRIGKGRIQLAVAGSTLKSRPRPCAHDMEFTGASADSSYSCMSLKAYPSPSEFTQQITLRQNQGKIDQTYAV